MTDEKQQTSKDVHPRRSISDLARGVTYLWADVVDLRSGCTMAVLPLDIPGGYPARSFVMLQDKSDLNLQEGFSQRAIAKGSEMGKQTVFVRMDCSVRMDHHIKTIRDQSAWDKLEFLAIDEMNLDNRYLLWDIIVSAAKNDAGKLAQDDPGLLESVQSAARGETNVVSAFIADPSRVGAAIFQCLPNLRLLSWDVSAMGAGLPRLNALAFRDMDMISNVEAFAHGHGFVDTPLELRMPEKDDIITESNRHDFYMPWV
jgi:hypothetical protein